MNQLVRFKALLEPDENTSATVVALPISALEVFCEKARVAVRGTINGFPFRSSIIPMGDRLLLMVNRALREAARVQAGDLVDIDLERDPKTRVMEPTLDLARALKGDPAAEREWEKLSYSHRKKLVLAIEEAKKPETRARRVRRAVEELLARMK